MIRGKRKNTLRKYFSGTGWMIEKQFDGPIRHIYVDELQSIQVLPYCRQWPYSTCQLIWGESLSDGNILDMTEFFLQAISCQV